MHIISVIFSKICILTNTEGNVTVKSIEDAELRVENEAIN